MFLYALCVLWGAAHVACGQKGPPLAPIVYVPRPVAELKAKRIEGDIVLQFTVPTVNTDNSGPADLERIDVYAHTGPLPRTDDFLKYGTLVHTIPVKEPPPPPPPVETTGDAPPAPPIPDPPAPVDPKAPVIEQGQTLALRETVTEKLMETGPMPPTRAAPPPVAGAVVVETLETPGTVNFALPPARYYAIVGVSRSRNRRGPYAGPIRVPLLEPLAPPESPQTTYTAEAISLSWPKLPDDVVTPPAPAVAAPAAAAAPNVAAPVDPLSDQETEGTYEIYADVETADTRDAPRGGAPPPARRAAPPPAPRFGYNVYDADAQPEPNAPLVPLNATLLTAPAFTDPRVEFGTKRCYVVRRVEMAGAVAIESAPSAPACVTPVDTFAPAPPKALALVASGTAVSLIWEAATETDLAGYLVLRGEAPDEKLAPLTAAPIGDAAYIDTSVRRNRTYVYEVVAVDKAGNQSGPSNRVEETIR